MQTPFGNHRLRGTIVSNMAGSNGRRARHDGPPTTVEERVFWQQGLRRVAGLDEVGRGPWAGPVYAAAVVLPVAPDELAALSEVRDSKRLSERRRERLAVEIQAVALAVAVGRAEADEIDELGIVAATRLAMRRALAGLELSPQALILDALRLPQIPLPQRAFPRADALSLSVAAASIVAKVARDRWMVDTADVAYPGYGFAQHKGYGTQQHRVALERLGVCPLHRRSFRPIADRVRTADVAECGDLG